jgi:cyclophilin family peptidyl-prolyl cis-trans isomerase
MKHHPFRDQRNRPMRSLFALILLVTLPGVAQDEAEPARAEPRANNPTVILETNYGRIEAELFADQAPKTVANFLDYARDGHYDGTLFHRVIDNFMIQGGGFDADFRQKPTREPIDNEADNGLSNERGTLAMARSNDPHSATSQFFINVADNDFLDHRNKLSGRTWGYAVFGKVVEGMDVVEEIAGVETTARGMHRDVPVDPVVIERVEVSE